MCGRFSTITSIAELKKRFEAETKIKLSPKYNVTPGQKIPVIYDKEIVLETWGLKAFNRHLINARAETISKYQGVKRCLIIADGFYEWQKNGNIKTPYRITLDDESPFAFAGIANEGTVAIITTTPNNIMKKIHNRMPVILDKDVEKDYLQGKNVSLNPYEGPMKAYPISSLINNSKNDSKEIIKSLTTLKTQ